MLKVKTTRFGTIEIKEEDIVTLPKGLIGFPELQRYILLDHDAKSPFKWLQSIDNPTIAFVMINPLLFKPDYIVEVTEGEVADLNLHNESDAVISVIITMPSDPKNMTANLKAPLLFNAENRLGKQIIINHSKYSTRHNIMLEIKKNMESDKVKETQEQLRQLQEDNYGKQQVHSA